MPLSEGWWRKSQPFPRSWSAGLLRIGFAFLNHRLALAEAWAGQQTSWWLCMWLAKPIPFQLGDSDNRGQWRHSATSYWWWQIVGLLPLFWLPDSCACFSPPFFWVMLLCPHLPCIWAEAAITRRLHTPGKSQMCESVLSRSPTTSENHGPSILFTSDSGTDGSKARPIRALLWG